MMMAVHVLVTNYLMHNPDAFSSADGSRCELRKIQDRPDLKKYDALSH